MVRVELGKWNQSIEDLARLAVESEHPRTRERFQALLLVAAGLTNASDWAARMGRENETVLGWIRSYNQTGPDALVYQKTGGRAPLLRR